MAKKKSAYRSGAVPGAALLTLIPEPAFIVMGGHVRAWNGAAFALLGYAADVLNKLPVEALLPQCSENIEGCLLEEHHAWTTLSNQQTFTLIVANGAPIPIQLQATWLPSDANTPTVLVVCKPRGVHRNAERSRLFIRQTDACGGNRGLIAGAVCDQGAFVSEPHNIYSRARTIDATS